MSHNTWIHRAVRIGLVKPLAKTPVTPNQLTTLRLAVGITAAAFMAVGPEWQVIGG
ncbi:MAG: CDP-alcohol phosphatidyltransferase family protein, partial [Alphaproteobacteria bacterium]|nr:CDP-alcohol phosphatidyltransferase family protein [Alphaproteobacteria bacterium]